MGGSSTTNTNGSSQSINEIPQWVQNAGQANYGLAQEVASQPLQQYQGQMVANVSPQMQQAWNLAANSGSVGVGAQNAAQAGYMNAENYTPQQVDPQTLAGTNLFPYMNPYTQDVINATLPIMQQGLALQQNQQQNAANSAEAYGGSKMGIQQGVTQAQGALNEAQMAAGLNQANFAQAVQGATGDITRNLQAQQGNQAAGLTANQQAIAAATGLGGLGNQQMQNQLAQYGMLTSAGAGQEQQQQNDINSQIAKFQQAWTYPQQQLGMMESSLGMTPYNTGTSGSSASTSETQTSNPAAIAGGAFGMLGSLFGGPAMGAGGLFGGSSDRRLKTDVKKIGMHHTGIPMYSYRYKGDPKTYPKIAGPMAEDVMKIAPHAVHAVDTAGHLAVHMPTLDAIRGTTSRYGGGLSPRHYAGGTSFVSPERLNALKSTLKYRDVGSDAYFKPGSDVSTASPARPGDAYGITPEESLALERAVGPNLLSHPEDYRPPGYAFGTPRVPGFGRRDTVPAMLTPGEAVLTRHGANLLGRRNINALNTPPSSPGVARAIGMLAPTRTPGRLSPFATPPTRSPRMAIAGALSGGR